MNKITASLNGAVTAVDKLETTLNTLKRELKAQAEAVTETEEERRREHEALSYALKQEYLALKDTANRERREALEEQARQDKLRDETFTTRMTKLIEVEDELYGLLGLKRPGDGSSHGPKAVRTAYETALSKAESTGFAKAENTLRKDYETQKKLDETASTTANALLKQSNEHLAQRNAALERQVNELLAQQSAVVGHMKELGINALQASAGVQGKAVDTMQAAVAGAAGSNPVRR